MTDCIIIGGGLIGMMTARALHREGMDVLILERGELARESTWAGGGILSPLYPWRYSDAINRLAGYSHQHYPAFAESLQQESGVDPEYRRSGLLILDPREQAAGMEWGQKWHIPVESRNRDDLRQLEPGLAFPAGKSLYFPTIGQLRNPRLGKALAAAMNNLGIRYRTHTEVSGYLQHQCRITGVRTTGGDTIHADRVVVAGGAWSASLFPQGVQAPHVEPVKGQMMIYRAEPHLLKAIVLHEGRYLIPRKDGRILIGSTLEYTGFDKTTTEEACQSLHRAAIQILPALENYAIEYHWAGLRPGTEKGIPYIGEHPEINGLYLNTGHFRNGVILGLASVELLKNVLMCQEPIVDPDPYSLAADH